MSKSMLSNVSCRGSRLARQYFLIFLCRASVHIHGYVSGLSFGTGMVALGKLLSVDKLAWINVFSSMNGRRGSKQGKIVES